MAYTCMNPGYRGESALNKFGPTRLLRFLTQAYGLTGSGAVSPISLGASISATPTQAAATRSSTVLAGQMASPGATRMNSAARPEPPFALRRCMSRSEPPPLPPRKPLAARLLHIRDHFSVPANVQDRPPSSPNSYFSLILPPSIFLVHDNLKDGAAVFTSNGVITAESRKAKKAKKDSKKVKYGTDYGMGGKYKGKAGSMGKSGKSGKGIPKSPFDRHSLRPLPPTSLPQCRVTWSLWRGSVLRADRLLLRRVVMCPNWGLRQVNGQVHGQVKWHVDGQERRHGHGRRRPTERRHFGRTRPRRLRRLRLRGCPHDAAV